MQIISTREFRANQKKYFDMAAEESVLIERRNASPILISVADDDMMSNDELISIQRGLEDVKAGQTYTLQKGEGLNKLIKRALSCTK